MRQLQLIDVVAPIQHDWLIAESVLDPFDQDLILNWRHVLQHYGISRGTKFFIGEHAHILHDDCFEEDNDEKNGDGCGHIHYFCPIEVSLFRH